MNLGAGRKSKEDEIDRRVGLILSKKIGDKVEVGETIAYIHANSSENMDVHVESLKDAYTIVHEMVEKESVIDEIL